VLEMAVVRLATMPAGDDVAQLLARIDALERALRKDPSGGGASGSAPRDERGGGSSGSAPRGKRGRGGSSPGSKRAKGAARTGVDAERAALGAGEESEWQTDPAEPTPSDGGFEAHPAVVLDRLRGFIGRDQPGLLAALEGAHLIERDDRHLRVFIEEPFAASRLRDRLESLEAACEQFFGRPIRVQIETAESQEEAKSREPSKARAALGGEALRELTQRALQNPAVNRAIEILDGEIIEIRPTGHAR